MIVPLPKILIIDDLFGRTNPSGKNLDRVRLCGQLLINDVTGDKQALGPTPKTPIADAVFCRGQTPRSSSVGDYVENDLEGTLDFIREGWDISKRNKSRWAMILLDLKFYTGTVTQESNASKEGMPHPNERAEDPSTYFGIKLLQAIQSNFADLPVVILSGQPKDPVIKDYARYGAKGFLIRGQHNSADLKRFLVNHGLIPDPTRQIIGYSVPLLLALCDARSAAAVVQADHEKRHILLRGETGTGKELLARYIHQQRPDSESAPMVTISSPQLAENLWATELFGIEPKVATGVDGREGAFVEANEGDLFLDEVKDLIPQAQAGLNRVLQEGTVSKVGSSNSRSVDVRVISATFADLMSCVSNRQFRKDLYMRLSGGGIVMLPPLRDRPEDLRLLVEKFVSDAVAQHPHALSRSIDDEVYDLFENHSWPGNIRELRSCVFKAVTKFPEVEHLAPIHVENYLVVDNPPSAIKSKSNQLKSTTELAESTESKELALDELLALLKAVDFDKFRYDDLDALRPHLYDSFGNLLAKFLKQCVLTTQKRTLDSPQVKFVATQAMRLFTGEEVKKSIPAYDLIKRWTKFISDLDPELIESETVLRELRDHAQSRRQSKSAKQ